MMNKLVLPKRTLAMLLALASLQFAWADASDDLVFENRYAGSYFRDGIELKPKASASDLLAGTSVFSETNDLEVGYLIASAKGTIASAEVMTEVLNGSGEVKFSTNRLAYANGSFYTLTVPALADGDYVLRLTLDPSGKVEECDKSNNVYERRFQVVGLVSDLRTATVDGFTYTYYLTSAGAVIGNNLACAVSPKPKDDLTVPSSLDGHSVVGIGPGAFAGCWPNDNYPGNLTLPDSITWIGSAAFCYTYVMDIKMPSSLVSLGRFVFYDCPWLGRIDLGASFREFGETPFEYAGESTAMFRLSVPMSFASRIPELLGPCSKLSEVYANDAPTGTSICFHYAPETRTMPSHWSIDDNWRTSYVHVVVGEFSYGALTIAPDVVVKFLPGAKLDISGACVAKGVTFTHAYDDTCGGDFLNDGTVTTPKTDDYQVRFGNLEGDQKTTFRYLSNPPKFTYVSVTNVVSRQRYPWNGLVDIDCEILCSDPATNINLYLSAKDNAANKSLSVRRVRLEGATAFTNALEVKAGKHRIVWDAGTDAPNVVSGDVTIDVQALVGMGNYLVIDLSGGRDAASYPVSYLDAEPQGGWTDEYKTSKIVMRYIQPGTYMMGCDTTEVGFAGNEAVPHLVTISRPFYIGVFPVTVAQYNRIIGDGRSTSLYPKNSISYDTIRGSVEGAKWPITNLVDSTSFLGIFRHKVGMRFDLPTEAQWEYACRAGSQTAYSCGDEINTDYVPFIYWSNLPVGTCKPNGWGLYDMNGNGWEWCLDWYVERNGFSSAEVIDPVGPMSGSLRVVRSEGRGGSREDCRSASRHFEKPDWYVYYTPWGDVGFRLCLDIIE